MDRVTFHAEKSADLYEAGPARFMQRCFDDLD